MSVDVLFNMKVKLREFKQKLQKKQKPYESLLTTLVGAMKTSTLFRPRLGIDAGVTHDVLSNSQGKPRVSFYFI